MSWIDDLETGDDGTDDSAGTTLFEENFRQMVENEEVDSLNVQTIASQVDQIHSTDLLEQAAAVDDREEAVAAYDERLHELDDDTEPTESATEEADDGAGADEGAGDLESDGGSGEATDEVDGVEGKSPETSSSPPSQPSPSSPSETESASETSQSDEEDEVEAIAEEIIEEEVAQNGADDAVSDSSSQTSTDPEEDEESADGPDEAENSLPDVNVGAIAPQATPREEATPNANARTLLVWGQEGTGKSHIAHSAPEPICYIDTEGKADDLADKFDKRIWYWNPTDYQEAVDAMEDALNVLAKFREAGYTGTIVVDSMTVMWEWAKVDYAKFAYQTDDLSEVQFQGIVEDDWKQIKGRHNDSFRDVILDAPYHVVFTAGEKDKYEVENDYETRKTDDGEKFNRHAVKDVVRLRRNRDGQTVGDLYKASRTRYSFVGLEWPEWDDIYASIDRLVHAEQATEDVDVTAWDFEVVDGQPVTEGSGGEGDE